MALFTRLRLIRAARTAAYAALALVALIVAAALVLPAFLNTRRVEAELQAKLSQAVHGEVAWQKLEIRLLPSPRGALSDLRAEIPGTARVRAARVEARLRLLPLLRGRAEITSVSLSKPVIALEIAPPSTGKKKPGDEAPADPVEAYRSVVEAVRRFAPEAALDIEDADLDVRMSGLPPMRLHKLALHGETGRSGLSVEAAAESEYWKRLKLSASVAYADLSGEAKLEAAEIRSQVWLDQFLADSPVRVALPVANLRAQARTDGKATLECDFDLDAPSTEIVRGSERVQIPMALGGKVQASGKEIAVRLTGARLGASRLAGGTARFALSDHSLSSVAEFDLDLAQAMDASRRLLADEAGGTLAAIQAVTGRAQGRVKFELPRSGWSALVEIGKSDASIAMAGLPGPVSLAGASVSITPGSAKIERAAVSLLDAHALASATIGYGKRLRIEGAVSEGSVGGDFLAWVWKTAGVPPHLALKTPIRVAVQHAAWSPKQPLDLAATAAFDAGPSVGAELAWTPKSLDIRRATIKDARSDATLALHVEKSLLEGRISGSLQSASIGAALKGTKVPSGDGSGDLRFRVDLKHPERFSAAGKLRVESMDLSWLLDRPVRIERVDLDADGTKLGIREASVSWAGQRFGLHGDLTRAADGAPVIDAQLESPGVVVDALLPKAGTREAAATEEKAKPRAADEADWTLWPLPVRGRIALRSEFIQYGERKAAPVVAALVLEEQKASLELQQVQLCGISLPLTVEATPKGLAVAARIAAQKQQLEQTARCLTAQGLQITGDFDLHADLRTRGRLRELLRNLEGTISAELRDGRVMKFALLGNILSMKGVADLLKEGEAKVDTKGFPYRSLTAKGRFAGGRFAIDESAFDSSAVGLAATGWISLTDYDSKLTVLVAPFARVDRLARKVPILGYIMGGALTSIPVGVSGDIRNPLVVPLGPGAVTSELVGIFERTLKLPEKLVPSQGAPAEPRPTQ